MEYYTLQEILEILRKNVKEHGSQKAFAKQYNISESYISDVLMHRRYPEDLILSIIGMEQVSLFRKLTT